MGRGRVLEPQRWNVHEKLSVKRDRLRPLGSREWLDLTTLVSRAHGSRKMSRKSGKAWLE